MTATPGRSPKADLANRLSSATKARSSTTTMVSCSITACTRATPPTRHSWPPAIERVISRSGRRPRTVTADRGYGEKKVDDDLHKLGVRTVVIPRKGKPSKARQAEEHRPAFRKTVKWRTGSEGRISNLKRVYGWDRTRLDGTEGAQIWTGHGILAHNLVKIAALAG
jgi:transposase, IS5 family